MEEFERDKIFKEKKRSDYLWCLHCERTYRWGEFRKVGNLQMCPYEGCGGDAVIDAKDWESIRDYHPEYDKIPEKDKVYPLHP